MDWHYGYPTHLTQENARINGWASCAECGKWVRVSKSGRLRKHKGKK